MEEFLEKLAEILEEESVNATDELTSFEAWDSLAILAIIALSDEKYKVQLKAEEVRKAGTVEGLYNLIQSKK